MPAVRILQPDLLTEARPRDVIICRGCKSNSDIRYTMDGKNPKNTSPRYVWPFTFRQNATGEKTAVKARI